MLEQKTKTLKCPKKEGSQPQSQHPEMPCVLSEHVLLGSSAVFSGGHDGTVHPICGQLNNGAHRCPRPSPRNLTWHIGQGSPGKQNQQDMCVRGKGIRKADRSHNLPSAASRPGRKPLVLSERIPSYLGRGTPLVLCRPSAGVRPPT